MEWGLVALENALNFTNVIGTFRRAFGANPVSTVVAERLQDKVVVIPVFELNAHIIRRSKSPSKTHIRHAIEFPKKTSYRPP
jgi:hypothetical protein